MLRSFRYSISFETSRLFRPSYVSSPSGLKCNFTSPVLHRRHLILNENWSIPFLSIDHIRRYSTLSSHDRIDWRRNELIFYNARRHKGHSHWQNIARTKMANDAQKGNKNECNPKLNKDLATVLEECAANNMPKDTINRALERIKNSPPAQTHTFDIYGRGGIFLVVEIETAQKRKTFTDLRRRITASKLGDFGLLESNAHEGFQEVGVIKVFKDSNAAKSATSEPTEESSNIKAAPPLTLNEAETLAIELECEEVRQVEPDPERGEAELFEFKCPPENVERIGSAFRVRGYVVQSADVEFIPAPAPVKTTPQMENSVKKLYEVLEGMEGVGRIFDNVDWDESE